MDILVVNVGSSSVKLRLVDESDEVPAGLDLGPGTEDLAGAAAELVRDTEDRLGAVGHRIVHGGRAFVDPVVLEGATDRRLEDLAELAPLHNPPALAAVRALHRLWPAVPHVACFDTGFHASLPPEAYTFALPRQWREAWGLRRYGFHGASHAWASRRAAALVARDPSELRLVTAHLGSGASLAAVAGGRSVDTTMGFTPLDGLVMATRSGSVDPGVLTWVMRHQGLGPDEVEAALEHGSGLAGLSGGSGDLREVMAGADGGDEAPALAYAVYVHRLRALVAAMAAAMAGMDGLVFTGGAGQASARLRADVCAGLEFLGIRLDGAANDTALGDAVISAPPSRVAVVVVEAREELEIARQVRRTLGWPPAAG